VTVVLWSALLIPPVSGAGPTEGASPPVPGTQVDFSYAFGLPHRMAVALPDSSDKTILEVHADRLGFRWTYGNLLNVPLGAYMPLYTWCEERGQEPATDKTSGDRQHLWTPAAVVRAVRDCLVMEEGPDLHLARGIARQWLGGGQPVGAPNTPTHFGSVSYEMRYDFRSHRLRGLLAFPKEPAVERVAMPVRLPQGLVVKSVNAESGATVLTDGAGMMWQKPTGEIEFSAEVQ
jgi:hypothetical protein